MQLGWRLLSRMQGFLRGQAMERQLRNASRYCREYDVQKGLLDVLSSFADRNTLYAYMHHHFHNLSPAYIREHRSYFKQERRGFGEDAFHAMWSLMFNHYRPEKCLEVGVYRGQTISLWSLIAKTSGFPCEVHGISPFTQLGDEVSSYLGGIDYYTDVLSSFDHFKLPTPYLLKALSTDNAAKLYIADREWDLIYIDGSHDYEIVLADYRLCKEHLAPNGMLVLDDASLGTNYVPPWFSFAGHEGPSRVARENADKEMRFICAVGHNNIYKKL